MKKKFLKVIILLVVVITSILSVNVFAETNSNYSLNVTMTANNSKIEAGGSVLITVKLSNINFGENGINNFTAKLEYDNDVFEQLTESSIDGENEWKPSYSIGSGKVQLLRQSFFKNDGEIMTITLKAKDGVNGKQGYVKLSNIIVSNSVDEKMIDEVSTNITVGDGNGEDGPVVLPSSNSVQSNTIKIGNSISGNSVNINPQSNSTNKVPTNSTIIPINNNTVTPTNSVLPIMNNTSNTSPVVNNTENEIQVINETESNSDMPYTGSDSNALIRIIIGVICISLVMYIKIERMNKEIK